ncbi:Hypothetical predicted protein, partial [Marmota monax]
DTTAPDATEADSDADPWRLSGDSAPTAAIVAAAAATTGADPLPAANNHHHYLCYHHLEDCSGETP